MTLYTTKIIAINPRTGKLTHFGGPKVPGICFEDAQLYCEENELGYCEVDGIWEGDIDEESGKRTVNKNHN